MINFSYLESHADELARSFKQGGIFEYVVIDGFCEEGPVTTLLGSFPDPLTEKIKKSRDYMFAKNKFEKSSFRDYGPEFEKLYTDLTSPRFRDLLHRITGENVFVDPDFHGGGLHQGGEGSFLDMHTDFNYHPVHNTWFRNLNILLYLNKDWKPDYGGQLKLQNKHSGETALIDPIFNRCVIMFTRDYTLHGYDRINFPKGMYRRSLAAYAYTEVEAPAREARSTTWYPAAGGSIKQFIGRHWPKLVRVKNRFLGSGTQANR